VLRDPLHCALTLPSPQSFESGFEQPVGLQSRQASLVVVPCGLGGESVAVVDEIDALHTRCQTLDRPSGGRHGFLDITGSEYGGTADREQFHRQIIEPSLDTQPVGSIEHSKGISGFSATHMEEGEGAEMLAFEHTVAGPGQVMQALLEKPLSLGAATVATSHSGNDLNTLCLTGMVADVAKVAPCLLGVG
jgi:hypothetical protein